MRIVIALLLTWVASGPAMAQVQGVTIYFIPWDVMTRAAFTAADVRSLARIKTEILDSQDRKSTRLNSSHRCISYAVFCLKKKKQKLHKTHRIISSILS